MNETNWLLALFLFISMVYLHSVYNSRASSLFKLLNIWSLLFLFYHKLCLKLWNYDHSIFTFFRSNDKVNTHLSSVIPQKCVSLPSDWMLYEEMTRSGLGLSCVRCCTVMSPATVAMFAGPAKLPPDAVKENSADGPGKRFQVKMWHMLYCPKIEIHSQHESCIFWQFFNKKT